MKDNGQLPVDYAARMQALLGADYAAYADALNHPAELALRVNTSKIGAAQFVEQFDRSLQPVAWCDGGFYCSDNIDLALHPYYHAGLFYIQEASAMAPVATMAVAPDDCVLDLCAAPGGKAVQIGNALSADGLLVVNDISASRLKAAIHHIERLGIKNAFVLAETVERLCRQMSASFDKVLVDAPCSGEGMFRKNRKMRAHWQPDDAQRYAAIQRDLAQWAFNLLAPGGELTYSTCTFAPLENEAVCADLLHSADRAALVAVEGPDFAAGLALPEAPETVRCARLYPHLLRGEGHFIGRLQRLTGSRQAVAANAANNPPQALADFMAAHLTAPLVGHFKTIGDQVYLLPQKQPATAGLRVLRSGWLLGKIKRQQFEPAHSFALGLTLGQVKQSLNLALGDERIVKYLKCESLAIDPSWQGWVVVAVDGFPLGWGKAQRGILKNKYPAHLRLMRTGRI